MSHEKILQMRQLNRTGSTQNTIVFQICGITYPNRSYLINRPASAISCAEYVVSGTGHVFFDGKEYTLHAGDSYLLPQGHDHYYYADKNDPWKKLWVNFSGELSLGMLRLWGLEQEPYYPGLDTSDLLKKLHYYAEHAETEHAAEHCTALLAQLFCRFSNRLYAPPCEEPSPVRKMQLYMEQHTAEPITLEQIAAVCGRSPSQAERIFRAETGVSLYHYALECKISIARQLLTETGMTVREIAAYLSFSDEFYFSGLFRRKVGISPSRYRKAGGKLPSPDDPASLL